MEAEGSGAATTDVSERVTLIFRHNVHHAVWVGHFTYFTPILPTPILPAI